MNLTQLFRDAMSFENHVRVQAEQLLIEMQQNNPNLFVLNSLNEFFNEAVSQETRIMGAIITRNTMKKYPGGPDKLWNSYPDEVRANLKNNIFSLLSNSSKQIQKNAATLIGVIWNIEVSQNKWADLLPTLIADSTNPELSKRQGVAYAFNSIVSSMEENQNIYPKESINQMLFGIRNGLKEEKDIDIELTSIQTFTEILPLTKEIFEDKQAREDFTNQILQLAASEDVDIKMEVFRCCGVLVKTFFDQLTNFYPKVWEITSEILNGDDIGLLATPIQVWVDIVSEYNERVSNPDTPSLQDRDAMQKMIEAMAPILMEKLLQVLGQDYDEDEDNRLMVMKDCLGLLSETMKEKYVHFASEFVERYFKSSIHSEKTASLIVFSSVLEGDETESFKEIALEKLSTIIDTLRETNIKITREEASCALRRIAEVLPEVLFSASHISGIISTINRLLDSDLGVLVNVAKLWEVIAERMGKSGELKKYREINITEIINKLLEKTLIEVDDMYYDMINSCFLAVENLLNGLDGDDIKLKFIRLFLERFKNIDEDTDPSRKVIMQSGLLSCLQVALRGLELKGQLEKQLAQEIFVLIKNNTEKNSEVESENMYVLGALAVAMGYAFEPYFDQGMSFISNCLTKDDEPDTFIAASATLTELSNSCPDKLGPHLEGIFKIYDSLIKKNKDCNKSIKLHIMTDIGDIVLGCKQVVAPFLRGLLDLYNVVIDECLTLTKEVDTEREDLNELRQNIIESFIAFFWGVNESQQMLNETLEFLPKVIAFLTTSCKNEPTEDFIKDAVTLLNDINIIYEVQLKSNSSSGLTSNLTKDIENLQTLLDSLSLDS